MVNLELWNRDRSIPRSFFDDMWEVLDGVDRKRTIPACDVTETQDHYVLSIDVPGIKKDEINIELTGRHLTISGERKLEDTNENINAYSRERPFGKFSRAFELPEGINSNVVEAIYEDGVLKVTVPKAETAKPKKIHITEGGKGFLKNFTHKSEAKAINA